MLEIKNQSPNLVTLGGGAISQIAVKDQLVWPKGKKYRYLRRNISALQWWTSWSSAMTMQASEFELLIWSTKFVWPSWTTISTNATHSGESETIDKLIDWNTNTKRCPNNLSWSWPLYAQIDFWDKIDLSSITNWRWYNWNDTASYTVRNPASWSIQVSNDLIDWKTISTFTSSESKSNTNYWIAYTWSINWENI